MEASRASDVLVVGGGMAGLTAACYLRKAGLTVTLCEKEAKTGGLVNSFDYKGFVFDGGIRAIEDSGIVFPMLRQLGVEVQFLPSPVSIGIGSDVIPVDSRDSLKTYQELLTKYFPENKWDIARITQDIGRVMEYMSVLYGIDNPLFLNLRENPGYLLRTILPWMVKYALTIPKISRLNGPVDEHLSRLTASQPLIDVIAQHFFQKTPAYFALSYFSLYLDYKYPRGGTGALSQAMERLFRDSGGEVIMETEIAEVDCGACRAVDSRGNVYRYRKLLWAADAKALYRLVRLESLRDARTVEAIQARQREVAEKVGGDSVLTLYLTLDLDKSYFAAKSSAHLFYTPSTSGLSNARLSDLLVDDRERSAGFVRDWPAISRWLKRFLELTTYEISCPVLRDASLAPEGKTGLIISTLFDFSLTEHVQRMGWYEEFKQAVTELIVERLDATIYPGLKSAIVDSFTSTPLTLKRVSGNSEGAITGWAFTNKSIPAVSSLPKVASSVLTPIPDIYQAGQWTFSPSGLPISILTGKLAADRILKDLG